MKKNWKRKIIFKESALKEMEYKYLKKRYLSRRIKLFV